MKENFTGNRHLLSSRNTTGVNKVYHHVVKECSSANLMPQCVFQILKSASQLSIHVCLRKAKRIECATNTHLEP
jgi:hypothetical protein